MLTMTSAGKSSLSCRQTVPDRQQQDARWDTFGLALEAESASAALEA